MGAKVAEAGVVAEPKAVVAVAVVAVADADIGVENGYPGLEIQIAHGGQYSRLIGVRQETILSGVISQRKEGV